MTSRPPLPLVLVLLLTSLCFSQETKRLYLSGQGIDDAVPWQFQVSAGAKSGAWTTLPVPSCWDALGFGQLIYGRNTPDRLNETGQYRHTFPVPADYAGQKLYLVFEGSMTDTEAKLNGQSVGPMHQGAFYRFEYDVTDLAKPGEKNLLEVTVHKQSANESINRAERQGDYWVFGGIFRPVYLEARPKHHIDRVAINARADGSFHMDVYTTSAPETATVKAQVLSPSQLGTRNSELGTFSSPVTDNKATLTTKLSSPKLWTAETPELYYVQVTLEDKSGKPLHVIRQRFGFRTIEVRPNDGIYVNGTRILLKGTNRHSFWPESGRAMSERLSLKDVHLMKEMNNNAVRMSHYPPDPHFLDACDEIGLYVLDELGGWQKSYDEPTARRLVGQMIRRDVNHPSILFWDNANEGGWNTAVDDEFGKWDPQQREVLHPWEKFRNTNTKHYPVYDLHKKLAEGPEVYFPTEFQHALYDGGGAASLEDYWDVTRTAKAAAGGFIWAFVDECMKRPDTGELDGNGNMAPDGLLDPYRQPEASFYAIKEIWSPIVVTRNGAGPLQVENRYDFTNTADCKFTWQLRRFASPKDNGPPFTLLAEGTLKSPTIPPHQSGTLDLPLPTTHPTADALALRITDPTGRELWTWVWPLTPPSQPGTRNSEPGTQLGTGNSELGTSSPRPPSIYSDTPKLTEDPTSLTLSARGTTLTLDKSTARITSLKRNDKPLPLTNGPRLLVGDARLTSLSHREDGADQVVSAEFAGNLRSVEWRLTNDGSLSLSYAYNLEGSYDFFGVGFTLPDPDLLSTRFLGYGPFRVWKNRQRGGTLGVWSNDHNNTMTGHSTWKYPEFKGYYAGVRWMTLSTPAGPLTLHLSDPTLYVQVLKPEFPGHPKPFSPTTASTRSINQGSHPSANAWTTFPDADLSILHAIPPIGTKFQIPSHRGPQGQQPTARGAYKATVHFTFDTAARQR